MAHITGIGDYREDTPGFLNLYSMSAALEDRAEVFLALFTKTAYLQSRCKSDEILASKVKAVKEIACKCCPDMNDAFWQELECVTRDSEK